VCARVHTTRTGAGAQQWSTVGVYVRLSQDREGQTSTDRQEADCRKLAADRGWTVHRTYSDVDLSGYTGVERPAFAEMMADLESGIIDGVVAWKLDRLSRNRRDWNRLATLVDEGAKLACVNDPVDTSTALGSVVVDLLASMARAESANTSTRVRRANLERAEAGLPHPSGQRAYGYRRDWTIEPAEAKVLRECADRLLAGESLNALCGDLKARGIVTTGGNSWRGWTLSRTLRSPHVAGMRTHHGQLHQGTWEPILDRPTWERLRSVLDSRGASHRGGGRLKHLLSGGVLVCGECGGR
jgi:site-specific DNA recombinase